MLRLAAAAGMLLVLAGCAEAPTQTIVRFRTDDAWAAPAGAKIRLQLWPHGVAQLEEPEDLGEYDFVDDLEVPVEPRGGNAKRRFTLFAEVVDGSERLSWARVRAGFAKGEISEVRVSLAADCPVPSDREPTGRPACGSHGTCIPGGSSGEATCAPSCYELEPFDPDRFGAASRPQQCTGDDCLAAEQLASTFDASCALADGRLFCWGRLAPSAELWEQPTWVRDASGRATHDPERPWEDFAFGARHLCGIRAGVLYCGGSDFEGQLGNGPADNEPCCGATPSGDLPPFRSVEAEGDYTCALDESGVMWCTGEDRVLGRIHQELLEVGLEGVRAIGAGRMFTCAATADDLRCFGNGAVLPGDGDPLPWSGGSVHARAETLCTVGGDGTAQCWGHTTDGDFPASEPLPLPARVHTLALAALHFQEPSVRCAIEEEERSLQCWGTNDSSGRLGRSPADVLEAPPEDPVRLGTARFTELTLGERHGCAVDEDGQLYCWGANDHRQLGVDGPSGPELRRLCLPAW